MKKPIADEEIEAFRGDIDNATLLFGMAFVSLALAYVAWGELLVAAVI